MKKLLSIMLGIVVASAMTVCAAEGGAKGKAEGKGGHGAPGGMFKKMDADGNGSLSLDEYTAAMSKGAAPDEKKKAAIEKRFKAADSNGDSALSKEEMEAYAKAHPAKPKDKAPEAAAPAAGGDKK